MSSNVKTPPSSRSDPGPATGLYRVAIVGAGTLKGKEVAEVLDARNFPSVDVKLLDDDESLGQLEAVHDEVTFIQRVRADEFRNMDVTFFASDPDCTRKNWKIARDLGSAIVDLSFALEDEPEAAVRSPWIERQLGHTLPPQLQPGPSVIAHPAAVVMALLTLRLQKRFSLKGIVATVFEPASEHGQKGMDELHEQTVKLLSFQEMPKNVFDTQVAFNLVSRYGEHALPALSTIGNRVVKHYQRIAGKDAPLPSLLLVQAPIFHGHAFAIHVAIDEVADIEQISRALAGEHVNLTHGAEDAPTNVNAAGQADIQVSVLPDSNQQNGFWLWAASDNLRVAASTAVECAETIVATRPRGTIQ
ncbi:MAG TPA: Asd/ArgC dimerization domain-containing protein [Terriglobales bacterium]|nr:Asd/ArgC dimerization domain-containing protein [Terriglobales bacterium]